MELKLIYASTEFVTKTIELTEIKKNMTKYKFILKSIQYTILMVCLTLSIPRKFSADFNKQNCTQLS